MSESRECKLEGMAICEAQLDNFRTEIVLTYITLPAIYTPDWQCDAYSWHDEGTYDYDIKNAEVKYPEEYKIITLDGKMIEGDNVITKILNVLKEDLRET